MTEKTELTFTSCINDFVLIFFYSQQIESMILALYKKFFTDKTKLTSLVYFVNRIFHYQKQNKVSYFAQEDKHCLLEFSKIRNYYAHLFFVNGVIINEKTGEVFERGNVDIKKDLETVKEVYHLCLDRLNSSIKIETNTNA